MEPEDEHRLASLETRIEGLTESMDLIDRLHGQMEAQARVIDLLLGYSPDARQSFLSIDPEKFEGLLLSKQMSDVSLQAAVARLRSQRALLTGN